jgi:hypothetical protein
VDSVLLEYIYVSPITTEDYKCAYFINQSSKALIIAKYNEVIEEDDSMAHYGDWILPLYGYGYKDNNGFDYAVECSSLKESIVSN